MRGGDSMDNYVPVSFLELEKYLVDILNIESFDDTMKHSIMRLQSFFNNENTENLSFYDIKSYIEENVSENLKRLNYKPFDSDLHKLNYAIVCVKNNYIKEQKRLDIENQRKFQEKIISQQSQNTDDEVMRMLGYDSSADKESCEENIEAFPKKQRGRPRKRKNSKKQGNKICFYCLKSKPESAYYKTNNRLHLGNDSHMPICKECIAKIYDDCIRMIEEEIVSNDILVDGYFIERKAIRYICEINNLYFSDSLFEAAISQGRDSMIKSYIKLLNLKQYKNKSYLNTLQESLSDREEKQDEIDMSWLNPNYSA